MIERAKTTILAVLVLGGIVTVTDSAHAFFCRYPRTHLSGVADVGGSKFVRLDIDLRFNGAECEVEIAGRGRCRPVGRRTLGVTFTIEGKCPSETFVIDNASYVRREGERIADVVLEMEFSNGQRCRITGTSPALYFNAPAFGGPLPSLSGLIVCPTTIGSPGVAEFVRR
jgi:hypothetical protein